MQVRTYQPYLMTFLCVTPYYSCSLFYLRQMVVIPVAVKQSRYLCFGQYCSVVLEAISEELLKFMA